MPNIKILVVEDDLLFALDVKMLIKDLEYDLVGIVDNSDEVIEIMENDKPDLILMDIKIKGDLNGIELAKRIQKKKKIGIIFMTSFDDQRFYDQAKETNHFGYLVKPFNKLTLQSTIEIAMLMLTESDKNISTETETDKNWNEGKILENCIFIKKNNKLEKVEINQIEFIQSEGNYCVISTEKKKYALKMSLIKVRKMLDPHPFARVNKRHIINMSLISSIDLSTNQININEVNFSIGRTYKEGLLKRLKTLS
ncbi:MAG: LytR/AlgR family response regulator transcription factor [Saprospiraceae bacterium]